MTQNMNIEIVRKSRTVMRLIGALVLLVLAGGNALAQVHVNGSVYGGGNLADVGGSVTVNMSAGTVDKNVYGGGAKANTNTGNWNFDAGTWADSYGTTSYKTTVNLLGGTVGGNAFGGGLGQKGFGTIGTTGYKEDIPAYVYGDVKVNLNGLEAETDINATLLTSLSASLTSLHEGETGYKRVKTTGVKGAVVSHVFGCNDMNGTPKGHVRVNVYATQKSDKTAITPKDGLHQEEGQLVMETTSPTTYDVAAVYGGGNLAPYEPVDGAAKSEVFIYGCNYTSIKQVYGGGNAASSPATYVRVDGAYEIEELFGGGNGKDDYEFENDWYDNPGANVGYRNYTYVVKDGEDGYDATIHGSGDEDTPYLAIDNNNAKTKEGRQTPENGYMYGSGVAKVEVFGGTIHASYGGSNTRGNVCTEAFSKYEEGGSCDLNVIETYGGGKDSDIDGKITLDLGCTTYMPKIYGGSKNADVFNNIELNITNGRYDKVFGGNNTSGNIHGYIIVNIEEQGCVPINITDLYLGGDQADYSIYGYDANGVITKEDYDGMTSAQQAAITVRNHPRLNIISASHIGNVYGGGYKAVVVGNPHINVNMEPGKVEVKKASANATDQYAFEDPENSGNYLVYKDGGGTPYDLATVDPDATDLTKFYANLPLGTIDNIFGGGNQANIVGDTYVEIGTGQWLKKGTDDVWETKDASGNTYTFEKKGTDTAPRWYLGDTPQESAPTPARKAANITGDVFGGGNGLADDVSSALVEGNTNIEMAYGEVKQSVYGGGNLAQVGGNTYVTVTGGTIGTAKEGTNVYGGAKYGNVYGGGKGNTANAESGLIKGDTYVNISGTTTNILHNVYGGGAYGSVGDFTFTTGVPSARAAGGTTNVTITGGMIGTDGHENGMVFGSSRGDVDTPAGTPAVDPNDKLAWVYDAKVTIGTSGATTGPQINGSIYGSGENGHTYHDTDVKVYSGTIGIDGTTDVTIYDLVSSGTESVLTESTTTVYTGKPYNYRYRGNVYGGGCGTDTYPGTTTYNPLAGVVYGTANVTIAGGLVVHNVYGAGAMGSVGSVGTTGTDGIFTSGGTTAIAISGGTVGVDGSDGGNVYGAARGNLEATQTDLAQVKTTGVTISSGTVYGNVYGGGEAGLVQSSTSVSMSDGTVGKNVYGGGMMGDVGIINKTDRSNPKWPAGTGACTVVISGGTVGSATSSTANHASGHVFGAGEGTATETSFYCDNAMAYNTSVTISNGTIYGNVYGGGEVARVETNTEVQIGQSQEAVANTTYYQKNTDDSYTAVDKAVGDNVAGLYTRSGESEPYVYTRIVASEPTVYGSVFGAGAGKETHGYSALVRGNSNVTIEGDAKVKQNVYGGGEIATVGRYKVAQKGNLTDDFKAAHPGIEVGMPYETTSGGTCTVIIRGDAVIGADGASETAGHVFGAGKGVGSDVYGAWAYTQDDTSTMPWRITIAPDPADMPTYKDDVGGGLIKEYYPSRAAYYKLLETLALATTTDVTISGRATVKGTVYGGSESGFVQGDTEVKVENGEIGTTGTTTYGNIFGGGKGLNTFAEAGRVKGSTEVAVSGGTTNGNVYGGGELGDVGTIDKTDINNYIWKGSGDEDPVNDTGVCTVTVSGTSTVVKGNVFGAGRGSGVTFQCEKAMVYRTIVSVENGTVNCNVYGGGEIGRVENNTEVKIGVKPDGGSGTYTPDIKGSVFGGGMGLKTHGYSALVRGNTEVTVEGDANAKVEGSVYGGGQIASVGRYGLDDKKMPEILLEGGYCTVTVKGSAKIGPDNYELDDKGNVFGAGKGDDTPYNNEVGDDDRSKRMVTYAPTRPKKPHDGDSKGTLWDPYDDPDNPYDDPDHPEFVWEYFTGDATTTGEDEYKTYLKTLALATHPNVTIGGSATVNGSVFGGGELGLTKGSVFVNILGGTIAKDVYGGGSLADTNTTDRHGYKDNTGNWATDENGDYAYTLGSPTTTVNLLGGKLRDAYGGALGKANSTIDATDGIPAYVHGNVKVNLNGLQSADDMDATTLSLINTLVDAESGYKKVKSDAKGAIVNRVFGCNNLNGTPKRQVKVYVYATQSNDPTKGTVSSGKTAANLNSGVYDVAAVYGGGNLAPYVPDDATLAYNETNKAAVEAARPEVYIDGCDLTSIKQVYGGGNAASVPATHVVVDRVYEIDEVFGGGNGYDLYTLNGETYVNPGANVGYYNYTHFVKNTTTGKYEPVDNDNPDCSDKDARGANYSYGSGIAKTEIRGGTVHTVYGGSNSKGNIRTKLSSTYSSMHDDCPMNIDQTYGSGKNAESDGEVEVVSNCAKGISEMFGGAKDADVDGDINLTITNGSSLERVFGGNNTSGAINGSITVTIKEGGCEPIRIGSLYAGGFLAPYSIYGYEKDTDGSYKTKPVKYIDENGDEQEKLQRIPLKKDDEGALEKPHADPRINVISATRIDNIFGGGYQAKLVGSPHINVNMEPGRIPGEYAETIGKPFVGTHTDANGNAYVITATDDTSGDGILAIGTIGNIYGGGNMADIVGNTYVEIGTGTEHSVTTGELVAISPARNAATITGNVFGGGKGKADTFTCEKAMVGVDNGTDKTIGNTHIIIGNGTVGTLENGKLKEGTGNVYGGGEIGRVENNTNVTLGVDGGIGPEIYGYVYGAGAGVNTHGYSALVRGNATVLIQGNTKVGKSVYGGGEIASVGRYKVADAAYHAAHPDVEIGLPYTTNEGGTCNVTIKGNAEIGPDNMKMVTDTGWPTDEGHVFGAGKGILPYELTNTTDNRPRRMWRVKSTDDDWVSEWDNDYDGTVDVDGSEVKYKDIWEYYDGVGQEPAYLKYIQSLALATTTEVTIEGNAFVKGSVYGGSMNGHVQANTHVVIDGDCQIGNGDGVNKRYTEKYGETVWTSGSTTSLPECASWPYGHDTGTTDENGKKIYEYLPYDVYDYQTGTTKPKPASDGHTFYGNVFGGGSGLFPYKQDPDWEVVKEELGNKSRKALGYSDGVWLRSAGAVNGNTHVEIKGGHVLTSVYGGNECTDVKGTSTVEMSGGTIGVPRTVDEIKAHPVTCYLFGAGKGDQRINFNTWTNVEKAIVNITGGHIFGSVFGGGEDGHVLGDVEMTISGNNTKIGTTGTSYVDGNIFGGGRGFSGDAQTAGTVGGNIEMTISGGDILGSVYGGGRLASVGTEFTAVDSPNYGNFVEDGEPIYYTQEDADAYNQENNLTEGMEDYKTTESIKTPATTHGHVTINISGGTIGNTVGNSESGNVFGGSMGRLILLNGAINDNWPKMAQVKSTTVNIYDNANVKRTVFGGGELGTVRDNAYVTIGGTLGADKQTVTKSGSPVVGRDVYGGGYGSQDYTTHTMITAKMPKEGVTSPSSANDYQDVNYVFTPMIFAGCVGQNTYVNISGGHVKKSVYGGGEMASVGIIDCQVQKDNDAAEPVYTEGSDKYVYIKNHKHNNPDNDFVLSWPYHFEYTPDYLGATHVKITGGRIGLNGEENKEANNPFEDLDNGDVCGGGKGIAGDYNNYVFCANVGSTEVTIDYPTSNNANPENYMTSDAIECIAGAVYGGAENGHVMGDTKLTLKNGLVGHSIYGGGSGKGQFETTLLKIGAPANSTAASDHYTRKIYSITAGKVFGNTEVIMEGGYVVRNVYGGGNMGSVGKGNYAGGPDDYSTAGYGEKITGDNNLWTNDNPYSQAFLSSGKSTVKILGGTVGYIADPETSVYGGLPYGNVFGGCRGEAAPNIRETPRYLYSPEFFVGYVNETDVTIGALGKDGPKISGSVFGGGMDGHVRRDTKITINSGEIGSENGGLDNGNVYGAGSGIGKYKYDFDYDGKYTSTVTYGGKETKEEDYSTSAGSVTRFTTVEIKGGKIHRNVYGGGSLSSVGAPKIGQGYDPYRPDDSEHSSEVGKQALNTVTISGGQIGDGSSYANGNYVYGGRVFGGSRGDTSLGSAFATANHTKVTVEEDAHVIGSVFGGGEAGIVKNDVTVTMSGGAVDHDFYGGGALANTNTSNWDASANNGAGAWADATNKSAVYTTAVNLKGGTIGRNAYGGGLGVKPVGSTAGTPALVYGDVLVKLNENTATDKCVVKGVVHGANNYFGSPKGDVTVHVYATMHDGKSNLTDKVSRDKDVEDALADNNATAADLKVFLADKISIATLWGVNVTEYQTVCDNPGATPADVKTAITGISDAITTAEAAATDEQKTTINANVNALRYDLKAVYGGGNEATYDPLDANTRKAHVIIDGCDLTSIETVYGGGNAAAAPETYVEVKSCYEIGTVFGGGNGKDALEDGTANPGAHVGYRDASATDSYGTGKAYAELKGGTIHSAFGGSNTKGNVRTSATVDMNEPTPITCPLCIDEVYGAGNEAHQDGTSNIELGCISYLKEIYGGAKNANINNDVVLTIQSGRFDRVFGGNNLGGIIKGTVTVNIEETGCHPIIIGQLYGGGNQAAYDVNLIPTTGHVTDQTDINYYMNYPKVNVKSFTSIGEIYGGGYGSSATVTGNPYVTINECMGENATIEMKTSPADESLHTGETITINSGQSDEVQVKIPLHKSGAIGAIGNVFGGGNAAPVSGNTNVIIGNLDKINYVSIPDDDTTTGVDESERTVLGVDIQGNVYGGGNAAPVSGNTNVVIGKDGTATTPSSGGSGSGSGSGDSGSGESGGGSGNG